MRNVAEMHSMKCWKMAEASTRRKEAPDGSSRTSVEHAGSQEQERNEEEVLDSPDQILKVE